MRGEDKRKHRAARLRLLNQSITFEEIARRLGEHANPHYLSQIANEYLGRGRKTPRGLSDNYASRIEQACGLPTGWFDEVDADSQIAESRPSYDVKTDPADQLTNALHVAIAQMDYIDRERLLGIAHALMDIAQSSAKKIRKPHVKQKKLSAQRKARAS